MGLDIQSERQEAHAYLDRLPDTQVSAVRGLLQAMIEGGRMDEEPVSDQDRRRFQDGEKWFAEHGKGISMDEVLSDFGLTHDDFPLKK